MLSILIPIYNYHPLALVKKLAEQCASAGIEFEILCYDDASEPSIQDLNKSLSSVKGVIYKELPVNYGRSRLRNLLAREAVYDTILFIDCDMAVSDDRFISRYLAVKDESDVIFGGLSYNKRSKDHSRSLRWKYGVEREAVSARNRTRKPWISLKTCNLMIKKSVFNKVGFSEELYGYGYEDTLFGINLQRKNIEVLHIDNPLLHMGIEDNSTFLVKAKEASQKLAQLLKNPDIAPFLGDMKIVKYYRLEKKLKLDRISLMKYQTLENTILKNLRSKNPSLALFDFYKLICLIRAMNN